MATRMQQRRGTAAQWTAANPILSAGEIGFETDTGQFKIGDGTTAWDDISYFKNLEDLGGSLDDYILLTEKGAANGVATLDGSASIPLSQLTNVIDSAPGTLNTLKELADSITDVGGIVQTSIADAIEAEMAARDSAIATAKTEAITAATTESATSAGELVDAEVVLRNEAIATAKTEAQTFATDAVTAADEGIRSDLGVDISNAQTAAQNFATQADSDLHTTITGEISTAVGNAEDNANAYTDTQISTHASDSTNVHGIADTSALATKTYADSAVSTHSDDTTNVHGIADTSALATKTYADGKASDAQTAAATSAATIYAPKASPTFTGTLTAADVEITGNLNVTGTTTTVNSQNLAVTDSLIYLAKNQYSADVLDIGIYGAYGTSGNNGGNHPHTGLVRDASDGKWKLISNGAEPTDSEVDFATANFDTLKLGGVEFSDGIQTKQGVPSITTISQKTASYTLSNLNERDTLIEVGSSSATTLTIPTDSTVNYPIGTTLDILQTSSGQVTIEGAGGVTVNATPGLKLRTQWSSATLMKRAANTWVVYGDLIA
jgi:hypothetical protein